MSNGPFFVAACAIGQFLVLCIAYTLWKRKLEKARIALAVVVWLFNQDQWRDLLNGHGHMRLWGEWGDPIEVEKLARATLEELSKECTPQQRSLNPWQSPHAKLPTE